MKARKIILTIYVLASFVAWIYALYALAPDANSCILNSCLLQVLVIEPLVILLVFGIPTVILLLIWGKDKNNENKF
jgi:hypothetical protein